MKTPERPTRGTRTASSTPMLGRRSAIALSVLGAASLLSGCSGGAAGIAPMPAGGDAVPVDVCVVGGTVANTAPIDEGFLTEHLLECARSGGCFSMVSLDGEPKLKVAPTYMGGRSENEDMYALEVKANVGSALGLCATPAESPERDLVAALSTAVQALGPDGGTRTRRIIVESPLSTSGVLDLVERPSVLLEPQQAAQALLPEMPDLAGCDVVFAGSPAAVAYGDQPRLTEQQARAVEELLVGLLAGAKSVSFAKTVRVQEQGGHLGGVSDLPPVGVIVPWDFVKVEFEQPADEGSLPADVSFDETSSVCFAYGTAEFVDFAAAMEQAGLIGEYLNANPGVYALVMGSTDRDPGLEGHNLELSQARAEAFAALVRERCGDPGQVEAVGYGDAAPFREDDSGDPAAAARNRCVRITFSTRS